MIISLVNQKGGVGKTTLAINISDYLYLEGCKVILIDSDLQFSSLDWATTRAYSNSFTVVGVPKAKVGVEINKIKNDYDFVIVDTPPRADAIIKSILAVSDLTLIPVQPSPCDSWASDKTVELINECSTFNENLKCRFVINRKISKTKISSDIKIELMKKNIIVCNSQITQRVVFATTLARGTTVCRYDEDNIASKEIIELVKEVIL